MNNVILLLIKSCIDLTANVLFKVRYHTLVIVHTLALTIIHITSFKIWPAVRHLTKDFWICQIILTVKKTLATETIEISFLRNSFCLSIRSWTSVRIIFFWIRLYVGHCTLFWDELTNTEAWYPDAALRNTILSLINSIHKVEK